MDLFSKLNLKEEEIELNDSRLETFRKIIREDNEPLFCSCMIDSLLEDNKLNNRSFLSWATSIFDDDFIFNNFEKYWNYIKTINKGEYDDNRK
ncbi:MAG: hypothetical protein KKD01_19645 [Proteobacteria bacterium]|nr:hypothetical protein [Pseudomonadota bacterium]